MLEMLEMMQMLEMQEKPGPSLMQHLEHMQHLCLEHKGPHVKQHVKQHAATYQAACRQALLSLHAFLLPFSDSDPVLRNLQIPSVWPAVSDFQNFLSRYTRKQTCKSVVHIRKFSGSDFKCSCGWVALDSCLTPSTLSCFHALPFLSRSTTAAGGGEGGGGEG
jgi:hypothetical protein